MHLVAMLVEGEQEFNRWSQEGAQRQAEKEQRIVYVKIKRITPIRSRIEELEVSASGKISDRRLFRRSGGMAMRRCGSVVDRSLA
jgi:hypothetical protein